MSINIAPADELSLALLEFVAENGKPIGQSALNLLLRRRGFGVSTPTVGRRLQGLEFEGMLASCGSRIATI